MDLNTVSKILETELLNVDGYSLRVYTFAIILLILLLTRLLLWLLHKVLFRKNALERLDKGNTYALFQIIKYVSWVVAIALILETIGIKVTVLIAGSAALLVGIGLGLQQTFNDIVSGIILLSEKSIKIDDVLEIDGDVVRIQNIGLRTSKALNTDDISIIIPNSLITTNKVINWSHQSKKTRFRIDVGVAYGSDIQKVIRILEESAFEHPEISDRELTLKPGLKIIVIKSLDFQMLYYSRHNVRDITELKVILEKSSIRNLQKITLPYLFHKWTCICDPMIL